MSFLRPLVTLLLWQLIGELLRLVLHLPIPGVVLGMVLFAAWLSRSKIGPDPALERTSDGLLSILGLLFVPAGVGIFANLPLIRPAILPIVTSLVVSTLLTLLVTARVLQWLFQRREARQA